jgi:hypothetical protein
MSPHVMQVEGYYNQLEKRIKQLELSTGLSSTNHAHQVWIFVTIVPQSLTPLTMFLGVFLKFSIILLEIQCLAPINHIAA